MDIYIITGSSGAGKSTALRALEDCGFFCIDNLPQVLLPSYIQFAQSSASTKKAALGIDIRSVEAMDQLVGHIKSLGQGPGATIKIIFLTSENASLIKRFQETRRSHPLQDQFDLVQAIEEEKKLLIPLKELADVVIQTDNLTIHELRAMIKGIGMQGTEQRMIVTLMSFGFKYGIPLESNFVYDVRSLPNPYFIPELTRLTGIDAHVQDYLFSLPMVQDYWQRIHDFVMFSLERSVAEGRSLVTVSIGCTGGKHRSVAFIERLATLQPENCLFITKHRDIQEK
jgi:UPF0042 nucleotide-binding protein